MAALAQGDIELDVLLDELDDHSVVLEVRGLEVREVDERIPRQVLAALLAQYAFPGKLFRDLTGVEREPLDENGLLEMVVEPRLQVVTSHLGHNMLGESPVGVPKNR